PHGFTGSGYYSQVGAAWAGEHPAGCSHFEHLDASVGQQRENIHDVEILDQGVGEFDESASQQSLSQPVGSFPKDLAPRARTSSSTASWPGCAPACITRTASAATLAITTASVCWSSLSGPDRSRYRLRAPRRTAPIWSGKPKMPRTPASTAGPRNAGQRDSSGCARSGSSTGRPL